jgi:Polysaccharide pyruvyl transferase
MLDDAPASSANRAESTAAPALGAAPRVLMLCGDAEHNLGDRAILQAMCQELRAVRPDIKLTVLSRDARRAGQDFGAEVLPPGWRGFARLCRAAMRSDLVLCGGGGLFQDDDSLIKMPYWGLRVALARMLARRVVGYALGVGPLRARSSRLSARLAFACMEPVSVRGPPGAGSGPASHEEAAGRAPRPGPVPESGRPRGSPRLADGSGCATGPPATNWRGAAPLVSAAEPNHSP